MYGKMAKMHKTEMADKFFTAANEFADIWRSKAAAKRRLLYLMVVVHGNIQMNQITGYT